MVPVVPLRIPLGWSLRVQITWSPIWNGRPSTTIGSPDSSPASATWRRARRLRSSTSLLRLAIINADPPRCRCSYQSATIASRTVSAFGCVTTTLPCLRSAADGLVDVAAAELVQRCSFGRVLLASVLDERQHRAALFEGGEHSTGVDLWQLLRVTDEHDLGAGRHRGVDERREGAGADHARLVDDQHGPCVEVSVTSIEVDVAASRSSSTRIPEPACSSCAAEAASAQPMTW